MRNALVVKRISFHASNVAVQVRILAGALRPINGPDTILWSKGRAPS